MVKEVYKNIDYTMSGVREDDVAMKHKLLPHYKLRPAKMDGHAKAAAAATSARVSLYLDHLLDAKYLDEYFANRK
jgi:hypothetical protein